MERYFFAFLMFFPLSLSAQVASIYRQIDADGQTNDYPRVVLAGGERNNWVQPIFATDGITGWTSDGANVTFTPNTGSISMQVGDLVRIRNIEGQGSTSLCTVRSVTSSTFSILVSPSLCDNDLGYLFPSGTGTSTSGYYEVIDGPARDSSGTWEVIDTSTGSKHVSAFLMDSTKTLIAAGAGCNPDLHSSSCYLAHPSLLGPSNGVYLEMGSQEPDAPCTMTGDIQHGNLVLGSDLSFTLRFTSHVDATKTAEFKYLVCQDGAGSGHKGTPAPSPGYRQMFTNEERPLFNVNWATSDQYTIWSVVSDDGLGDGFLETFNAPAGDTFNHNSGKLPEAVFHSGTVKDGYTFTVCSDKDPASCNWTRIFVSDQVKPTGNADLVEFAPCDIDPVMTAAGGTVYEIGPGQTYAGIKDIPTTALPWGYTVRFHGETASPGSPLHINEYAELRIPTNYASHTGTQVPGAYICGFPIPSTGELPILDGLNSTANINVNQFTGQGNILTLNGQPPSLPNFDVYTGVEQPFNHVTVSNIRFQNATENVPYYLPGQPVGGNSSVFSNSDSVRPFSIQQYAVIGTRSINVANPYFGSCNSRGGWLRNCNLDGYYEGNHAEGYGINTHFTEHAMYLQDIRDWWVMGLLDGSVAGSGGTGYYSFRSSRSFFMYSRGIPKSPYTSASGQGGDGEVQDNSGYEDPNRAFGPTTTWDGNCSDGSANYPFCTFPSADRPPAFGGLDTYAAFQEEHQQSMFILGNAFGLTTGNCGTGIAQTNADNSLTMQHTLYYYYNVVDCPYSGVSLFEDVRVGSLSGNTNEAQPVDWPHGYFVNNVLVWNDNTGCSYGGCSVHGVQPTGPVTFQTNLVHTGQFSLATGITQQIGVLSGNNTSGLNQTARYFDYGGMSTVEAKIGGWSNAANFISTSTHPYNATSLAPESGSPSIGAATALHYPMSLYPPIFNAVDANMNITRRIDQTTAGPYDPAAPATPVSIAITPNPIALLTSQSAVLVCTTTMSDSSTRNCFSPSCTSTNTASATVSGLTVTATATPGTGTVSCTAESLTAPGDAFTVSFPPPVPPSGAFGHGLYFGTGTIH